MQVADSKTNKFVAGGSVVLSTAWLPPVDYFIAIANSDKILIDPWEYYQKQSYRNRCSIATANGIMALSIPVEKPEGNKSPVRDVRISGHGNWQLQHWKTLESAYLSSPFFEYYVDDFKPFFEKQYDYLIDYNTELLECICNLLDLQPQFQMTDSYLQTDQNISDLREIIHPKKETNIFPVKPYYQVFQSKFGFITGLSIVDLLFNMGNESIFYLKCL